ncbi:hypothetical protein [Streptomyces sp. NPDC051219]|uniref:hypothetical protein n=1 Tax=Streptomyces sp. NPDC051219 TaxID=3155283 RepID=UPI003413E8C6
MQGDMERAAAAYLAARSEAEEHGVVGETDMVQAHLAFAVAFTDPLRADDELDLADRLLSRLSLRSTEMTARIATLVRDAGFAADLPDRAAVLLAEIDVSGISYAAAKLQLALCFHHAALDAQDDLATTITRLRELTQSGATPTTSKSRTSWPAFRFPSTPREHSGSTESGRPANDGATWIRHVEVASARLVRPQRATSARSQRPQADAAGCLGAIWESTRSPSPFETTAPQHHYDRRSWTGWSAPRS